MRLARMSEGQPSCGGEKIIGGKPERTGQGRNQPRSGGGFSRSRSIRDRSAMDTSTRRASSVSVMSRPVFSKGHTLPHGFAAWREYVK